MNQCNKKDVLREILKQLILKNLVSVQFVLILNLINFLGNADRH